MPRTIFHAYLLFIWISNNFYFFKSISDSFHDIVNYKWLFSSQFFLSFIHYLYQKSNYVLGVKSEEYHLKQKEKKMKNSVNLLLKIYMIFICLTWQDTWWIRKYIYFWHTFCYRQLLTKKYLRKSYLLNLFWNFKVSIFLLNWFNAVSISVNNS